MLIHHRVFSRNLFKDEGPAHRDKNGWSGNNI